MAAPKPEILIGGLSEGDLRTLQRTDAFAFHSIPAVHRARLRIERLDLSEVASQQAAARGQGTAIPRKTRLSTESHADVLLEDLLEDAEFMAMAAREFDSRRATRCWIVCSSSSSSSVKDGDQASHSS